MIDFFRCPLLAFGFLLLSSATGFAAIMCGDEATQTEMNMCAHDKYVASDAALNTLYQQKMKTLSAPTAKRLRDAQRAWVAYRDKTCLYEVGPQEESGTIWPLLNQDCLTAATAQRIEMLKKYVACDDEGCPN